MTPEGISQLLDDLNKNYFKNLFTIEYTNCEGDEASWGPHVWSLTYKNNYDAEISKICWMNNEHSFEIRHAYSSDFVNWADCTVLDKVAEQFDGIISDDGVEEKWAPKPIKSFPEYVAEFWGVGNPEKHGMKNLVTLFFIFRCAPKEFRSDLKAFFKGEKK